MYACLQHPNNVELITFLLEEGADPNVWCGSEYSEYKRMTPLTLLYQDDEINPEIVELLLKYDAKPDGNYSPDFSSPDENSSDDEQEDFDFEPTDKDPEAGLGWLLSTEMMIGGDDYLENESIRKTIKLLFIYGAKVNYYRILNDAYGAEDEEMIEFLEKYHEEIGKRLNEK
jgi:hypothetical protein